MTSSKISVAALVAGALALSACTDPGTLGTQDGNPNQKRNQGALIGAGAGALLGALVSDDGDRADGALIGAVVGGGVGAAIGYNLDQQEAELRQQMGSDVAITNTGDRLIVTLPNALLFATDSTALTPTLQGDLAALARSLQRYPASTVQVVGHTDSDGSAEYNQSLSDRRTSANSS